MQRVISISQSEISIQEVLRQVTTNGDEVVLEQDGEPVAVVVSIAAYRQLQPQRSRDAFFQSMKEMAQNANMDPEEADALAEEAVRWARSNNDKQ